MSDTRIKTLVSKPICSGFYYTFILMSIDLKNFEGIRVWACVDMRDKTWKDVELSN